MNKYEQWQVLFEDRTRIQVSTTAVYCRECALAIWTNEYPLDADLGFFAPVDIGYRLVLDEANASYTSLPVTCGH